MGGIGELPKSGREAIEPIQRYIFVVSRPAGKTTNPELLIGVLETLGVRVDHQYGVVAIDLVKMRFAMRGTAQADVIERISHDPKIEVFIDSQVESM